MEVRARSSAHEVSDNPALKKTWTRLEFCFNICKMGARSPRDRPGAVRGPQEESRVPQSGGFHSTLIILVMMTLDSLYEGECKKHDHVPSYPAHSISPGTPHVTVDAIKPAPTFPRPTPSPRMRGRSRETTRHWPTNRQRRVTVTVTGTGSMRQGRGGNKDPALGGCCCCCYSPPKLASSSSPLPVPDYCCIESAHHT